MDHQYAWIPLGAGDITDIAFRETVARHAAAVQRMQRAESEMRAASLELAGTHGEVCARFRAINAKAVDVRAPKKKAGGA